MNGVHKFRIRKVNDGKTGRQTRGSQRQADRGRAGAHSSLAVSPACARATSRPMPAARWVRSTPPSPTSTSSSCTSIRSRWRGWERPCEQEATGAAEPRARLKALAKAYLVFRARQPHGVEGAVRTPHGARRAGARMAPGRTCGADPASGRAACPAAADAGTRRSCWPAPAPCSPPSTASSPSRSKTGSSASRPPTSKASCWVSSTRW